MFICHRDLGVVVGCAVCVEVGSQLKLEEREGWSLSDAALWPLAPVRTGGGILI